MSVLIREAERLYGAESSSSNGKEPREEDVFAWLEATPGAQDR